MITPIKPAISVWEVTNSGYLALRSVADNEYYPSRKEAMLAAAELWENGQPVEVYEYAVRKLNKVTFMLLLNDKMWWMYKDVIVSREKAEEFSDNMGATGSIRLEVNKYRRSIRKRSG